MSISIIIPNYNGEGLLKKNLPKVIDAAEYYQSKNNVNVEIIIVDDGSTDSSTQEIKNQRSKIKNINQKLKIIENEINLGFASSVNKGVMEARGEIIILLNTDVSPEKGFLIPLIKHFDNSEVFAVGCMDKSIEGSKTVLRGRGLGKWEKGFFIHRRGEVDRKDTLWVSCGSGAFRKNIWERLGGLNPVYCPFYWEDIDLSYRALKSGYKILFEKESVIIHEHSIGAIKTKYSVSEIKKIAYRNQFIFVWINATDIDILFSHFVWLPYHLLKAMLSDDLYLLSGFFRAFILLPKIIKSRITTQKLFVKKDKEIIASVSKIQI